MRKIVLMGIMICALGVGVFVVGTTIERNIKYPIDESLKGRVTHVVVEKGERELHLHHNKEILKTYKPIALGKNPIGHKHFEGDSKTPEGKYIIDSKNPKSRYFLNLGISYPNDKDKQYAQKFGKSPGGDIKIHGLPNGLSVAKAVFKSYGDWTDGCIAVDNESMQEIYEVVSVGTPIFINP